MPVRLSEIKRPKTPFSGGGGRNIMGQGCKLDTHKDFSSLPIVGGWGTMLPLALGVLLFLMSGFLRSTSLAALPKVPTAAEGRTYPLMPELPGRPTVFASLGESLVYHGLIIAGFVVGGVGIVREKQTRARSGS